MKYTTIDWTDLSVRLRLSSFHPLGSDSEHHVMIEMTDTSMNTPTQFKSIESACQRIQQNDNLGNTTLVFKRYFVSDASNQTEYLSNIDENSAAAVSIVQQPPLNGTKVSIWLYFVSNGKLSKKGTTSILKRKHYNHLYTTGMCYPMQNEYEETKKIFSDYTSLLSENNSNLKDNCIRTWIYVQGVDLHYLDMVKARTEIFTKEGLTKDTHYIASTGIEGRHINPKSLVLMDAYAIEGIDKRQIKHLIAPKNLNPTHEYNVTFERGTSVDFGDRRHVYISGTASINNKGDVLHLGDIKKQIQRTLDNIEALLAEANTTMQDIAQMIIYLRDSADYVVVNNFFENHYPNTPHVIVLAPVCRPSWLFEVECIAIGETQDAKFLHF